MLKNLKNKIFKIFRIIKKKNRMNNNLKKIIYAFFLQNFEIITTIIQQNL